MRSGVALACAALCACAPLPPGPEPAVGTDVSALPDARSSTARAVAIARQAELARAAGESGDHAAALAHQEVLVLLDPANPAHRRAAETSRAEIERGVREQLAAGAAARRRGDAARARDAYLRVLALDPAQHRGGGGTARHRAAADGAHAGRPRGARARAGCGGGRGPHPGTRAGAGRGLRPRAAHRARTIRATWRSGCARRAPGSAANAGDREGRGRLAAAVAERARDAERAAQRERALSLYEAASALRGEPLPEWSGRVRELRRALGEAQYAEGVRAMRTDLSAAIRHFEASLRFDPDNAKAQERLRDSRLAQEKLRKLAPR